MVSIDEARKRRTPIVWRKEDLAKPEFTGVRVLEDFSLATLREFIDWTPFFHTWGMKGIYPRIMEGEGQGAEAKKIFADAQVLLDRIIAENLITARGVYGLFPANAFGDVYKRQEARRAAGVCRSAGCAAEFELRDYDSGGLSGSPGDAAAGDAGHPSAAEGRRV